MLANPTLLAQSTLFHLLDEEESATLAALLIEAHYKKDDVIFKFDDSGDSLYIVQNGSVELSIRDHTGEKIILETDSSGDMFGELSLLDNGPRTASAIAVEDVDLWILQKKDLLTFLRKKPDAALNLLAVLGGRLRQTNSLLRGRTSRNANMAIEQDLSWGQRLANFIAAFSGSMTFLSLNAVVFVVWILFNVKIIPGIVPFDPYPFGFLTMAVSLEAIFLSIFVLLAQNLQAAKDRIRGDIEYEVNLKAELEIFHLHEKMDHLNEKILHYLARAGK